MAPNPTRENFDRLAAVHRDRFKQGFIDALNDLNTLYVKVSHLYRPGEKASVMHVHVRDRMTQRFAGVRGIKIEDKPGRAFKVKMDGAPYGIDAKAEFKCKKLRANLLTSNIRTKTVEAFEQGLPEPKPHVQTTFEDWREPETTGGIEPGHGVAGYIIDALWLNFTRLCVTCFTGLRSARLAVEIPLDGVSAPVKILPLADIQDVTSRKRVKARKKKPTEAKPAQRKQLKLASPANKTIEKEKRKRARNNGEDS